MSSSYDDYDELDDDDYYYSSSAPPEPDPAPPPPVATPDDPHAVGKHFLAEARAKLAAMDGGVRRR